MRDGNLAGKEVTAVRRGSPVIDVKVRNTDNRQLAHPAARTTLATTILLLCGC